MTCSLRVVSDIHTERWDGDLVSKSKIDLLLGESGQSTRQLLVLAGDIGDPIKFPNRYQYLVATASKNYEKTFIVAGNHEYYTTNSATSAMQEVEDRIREICGQYPNVTFLQKDQEVYKGLRFLGCTLWTRGNPVFQDYINDYRNITDFTESSRTSLFIDHSLWLRDSLATASQNWTQTVVITHHLPSFLLLSTKFRGHLLDKAYASNLDDLVSLANVWICGHSHERKRLNIDGCECVLNPIGYEHEKTGFQEYEVVELIPTG